MAKLIIKNSYLKSKSKTHIGNLVKYISTRDGVQKVFDVDKAVTKNQEKLIDDLLKEFPTAKNSFEYEDYKLNPNSKTASDFIETAIEHNLDSIAKKENYVGYIANRPQVEKLAEHGLFSGTDENVDLKKVTDEIVNHKGCIWTPIISLKREDASRVDFEDYESWKNLISANVTEFARAMKIHPDNFRWYAAFHQADSHPHIHMICYSTNPKEGYLTTTGIEKIKSKLMNEIFSQELIPLYQEKTILRDKLKDEFQTAIENLQEKISSGNLENPQLEFLMAELKEKLDNTTGKKVYGYLKPNVKEIVDKIVDELENIPEIKNCYDLWWEMQQEIYSNYQDKIIKPLPLSKQTEFKSIKNMIVYEVSKVPSDIKINDNINVQETIDNNVTFGSVSSENFCMQWNDNYKQAKKYLFGDKDNEPDFEKAKELLLVEYENKNVLATFDLARMYADGLGVPVDKEKADELYALALKGFIEIENSNSNEYTEYRIGKMYSSGLGTEQDYKTSASWFEKSAMQNYKFAQYSLGSQYLYGQGVDKDDSQAFNLYLQSAEQGFCYAQYEVGKMFRDGVGTIPNLSESDKYFKLAFQEFLNLSQENNDDKLMYRIGTMYEKGVGTEIDLIKAKEYYLKSAKLNNEFAQYQLGRLFLFGNGVDVDKEEAINWFNLSAEQGNENAKYFLENMDKWENQSTAFSVMNVLNSLSRVFENENQNFDKQSHPKIDSNAIREMRKRKQALGQKLDLKEMKL